MKSLFFAALPLALRADDKACRDATQRGSQIVIKAASNWQDHKTCFACHHHTLPMLAMTEAARAGLALGAA